MSALPSPDPVYPSILLGMTATTGIVGAVSLSALGHVFTANMTGNVLFLGVIGLTALAMGFRNATTRKLGVPDLTTTVLTLTITSLAADSSLAGGTNPRWRRRVASVLLMFGGATVGGVIPEAFGRSGTMPVRDRIGRMCSRGVRTVSSSSWGRFTERPASVRELKDLEQPVWR
jgi:uncharacterized membrane protein YoaK (UPF0700 family)